MKCAGITTKNTQCKRNAIVNGYCNLHKIIDKKIPDIIYKISYESLGFTSLGECILCTDNVYDINDSKLKCGHIFHINCIKKLRKCVCPMCRKKLDSPLLENKDISEINDRFKSDMIEENRISASDYQRLENTSSEDESQNLEDEVIFELSFIEYIEAISHLTGLSYEEICLDLLI